MEVEGHLNVEDPLPQGMGERRIFVKVETLKQLYLIIVLTV